MADFLGLMKQAAELKSKMEAMQAELDRIEVEGTAGGGLVTVTLSGKGELKRRQDRRFAAQAGPEGNPRGSDRRRACRCRRKLEALLQEQDAGAHRRPAAAAGTEAVLKHVMPPPSWEPMPLNHARNRTAGPEIERLIQLLARLPGLGPRSARRAALFLIKKRELLMAPLAAALQTAIEKIEICKICGNIDTQNPCTVCTDPRRDPSRHRGGRRRRRSLGAGARARHQRALSRARRHAVAARRRRAATT